MMRIQLFFLSVVFTGVVKAGDSGVSVAKKNHNGDAHDVLCDLLKEAVGKWGESGEGLSVPLREALARTIFGKHDGGDLEKLKSSMPEDYTKLNELRTNYCGEPYHGDWYVDAPTRWSGHSAPHGLLCLCTPGDKGWPINESTIAKTLCGKTKDDLGGGSGGWSGNGTGITQIKATWTNVVSKCLEGGRQKGGKLKEALNNFLNKLQHKPDVSANPSRYILGENNVTEKDYDACTGYPNRGVCVAYFNATSPMPWWVDLERAIPEDEKFQKQRAEEEKRKQQEEAAKIEAKNTEDLKSGPHMNNQTEQNKTATLHQTMRKLNLTGSSSIILPPSWLLRAVFLF